MVKYQASMDSTPTGILPPKVSSEGGEGSSKASKGHKKKKQDEKPKEVAEEVIKEVVPKNTVKRALKRTKKHAKESSASEPTKFTDKPIVETIVNQSETVATEIRTKKERAVKKEISKRVKQLQFTKTGVVVREISSPNSSA